MIDSTLLLDGPLPLPRFFYSICLDLFAVVQYWRPKLMGIERGRAFERLFYRYCKTRKLGLLECAGSRTLRGEHSASGFSHEQDAVIASPELTFHIEMKHLGEPLGKNELLIFSHKGLDFLSGASVGFRTRPLFRILLSGSMLRQEARRFALQWGIVTIEPERIPLPLLHYLAHSDIGGLPEEDIAEMRKVLKEATTSLQSIVHGLSGLLKGTHPLRNSGWADRVLNVMQIKWGDLFWAQLDKRTDGTWLEDRYDALDRELLLYQI